MKKRKKCFKDRNDAYYVKNLDPMHKYIPYVMPTRSESESYLSETIDITNILSYLEKKNKDRDTDKYTLFHVISAVMAKAVIERPHLRRFIYAKRIYEHKKLTLGFMAKLKFEDESSEGFAFIEFDENDTIDTIHDKILEKVNGFRSGKSDTSRDVMKILTSMPRPLIKLATGIIKLLEYYGHLPQSLVKEEPYHSTVFLTNLGSVGLNGGYHHLVNWGTTSLFVVIGEKYIGPEFNKDGSYEMKNKLKLGFTVDERISDGFYYAKSFKLIKYLLQNPELLELKGKIDYEK